MRIETNNDKISPNIMKNKSRRIIRYAILVLILLVVLYALFMAPAVLPSEHTQLYKYKIIKNHWWDGPPELVEHFPQKLPDEASDIRLYFTPPFLMGGGYFQLKIKYSDNQKIQPLFDRFYEQRLCLYSENKGFYDPKDPKAYFDIPCDELHCYLNETNMYHSEDFPSDFTVILLKAKESGSPGVRWNHGDIAGVAVNQNAGTIVYFAEIW